MRIMYRPKDGALTRYVRIGVTVDNSEYWNWCRDNVAGKTWMKMMSMAGPGAGYYFENDEDATAFTLIFGLRSDDAPS